MEIGACDRSLRKRTSPPCVDRLIGAGCCDGGDFCEFPPLAAAIRHDRIVLGDVPVAVTAGFARLRSLCEAAYERQSLRVDGNVRTYQALYAVQRWLEHLRFASRGGCAADHEDCVRFWAVFPMGRVGKTAVCMRFGRTSKTIREAEIGP